MSNRAKAATLILFVLIIIAFSLAGGLYYLFQAEHAKYVSLHQDLEDTISKYKRAESELDNSKEKISNLILQIKEASNKLEELNNELSQEKAAKQDALARADSLAAELEQLNTTKSDLEGKLNQAQEDTKKVQDQLNELSSQKVELESKIKELESKTQGVELGKIVVNPEGASSETKEVPAEPISEQVETPPLGKEGKVLVVNKDYNFVVLNLGSKDGIDIGNTFTVYNNNKDIGDVKVEKVHESMAAAGFVSSDMKDKVSEGDKVVQKVK
jgi:myosin heavy subunit